MNYNLFSANNFNFNMPRAPIFSHFAQLVTPPGQDLGTAQYPTTPVNLKVPGSSVNFDTMTVTANMDQNWLAYEEIHKWMRGMATPYHDGEWMDIQTHFQTEGMPAFVLDSLPDLTRFDSKALNSYSDATLFIKDGHNNSLAKLHMDYIYPNSIQLGEFDTTAQEGVAQFSLTVTFEVNDYVFERLNNPWS